jgi:hypothetical protein
MLTEVPHGDAAGAAFNNENDWRMTGRPGPGIERWHEIDERNAARGKRACRCHQVLTCSLARLRFEESSFRCRVIQLKYAGGAAQELIGLACHG